MDALAVNELKRQHVSVDARVASKTDSQSLPRRYKAVEWGTTISARGELPLAHQHRTFSSDALALLHLPLSLYADTEERHFRRDMRREELINVT